MKPDRSWRGKCTETQHIIAPSDYAKYTVCKTEERKDPNGRLKRRPSEALPKKKCRREQVHLERQNSQDPGGL